MLIIKRHDDLVQDSVNIKHVDIKRHDSQWNGTSAGPASTEHPSTKPTYNDRV